MNRKKCIILSVAVGLLLAVWSLPYAGRMPMAQAWWGTLYPRYCYSEVPRAADGEAAEIEIAFKWLNGL